MVSTVSLPKNLGGWGLPTPSKLAFQVGVDFVPNYLRIQIPEMGPILQLEGLRMNLLDDEKVTPFPLKQKPGGCGKNNVQKCWLELQTEII